MRRAHAAAAADGDLLRAGREGQRAVLRPEAGERDAVDEGVVDLRPADEPALHAGDEPAEAVRPGRVRGLLPPREPARAAGDVVGGAPGWAVAAVWVRGAAAAGQGEPGPLLGEGREPGGFGDADRSGRDCGGDRGGLTGGAGAVRGDCGRSGRGGGVDSATRRDRPRPDRRWGANATPPEGA